MLACTVVTDGTPHLFDASGETGIGEEAMAPYLVQQLDLLDDSVPVFDEVHQEVEGLRLEMNRRVTAGQFPGCRNQLEIAEPVHR